MNAAGILLMIILDGVLYALVRRRPLLKPMEEREPGKSPRHSLPNSYQVTAWGKAKGNETPKENAHREASEEMPMTPLELIDALANRSVMVMDEKQGEKHTTAFAVLVSEEELARIPEQEFLTPITKVEAETIRPLPYDIMKGTDRYKVRSGTGLETWEDERRAILKAFELMQGVKPPPLPGA